MLIRAFGWIPEWPKGADCKSVATRFDGSNPSPSIGVFVKEAPAQPRCRSGGTGRRPGLKIPWVAIPVPVRFRSAALKSLEKSGLFCFLKFFGKKCLDKRTL